MSDNYKPLDHQAKVNLVLALHDFAEILTMAYQKKGLVLPAEEAIHRAWTLLLRGGQNNMDQQAVNPLDMIDFSAETISPGIKGERGDREYCTAHTQVLPCSVCDRSDPQYG